MRIAWPRPDEAVLAAACAVWAAFFLGGEGAPALLATPLVGLAVLPYRRRPVAAALGVAVLGVVHGQILGVPSENPSLLAALFVVVYSLGRYTNRRRSVAPLALLLVSFVSADPAVPTLVFGCVLFGVVWTFGYLVRRRTQDAARATKAAAELAGLDPADHAEQVVAEERARLAGESLAVVRGAVVTMQRHARAAEDDLDPSRLVAIQEEGRRATGELRRLLGLLRTEPDNPPAPGAVPPRWQWRTDPLIATGLVGLCLVEAAVAPETPPTTTAVVVSLFLAVAVAARRIDPSLACVLAVVSPALALGLDVALPYGLWSAAAAALLAWSVTVRGHAGGYATLAVLVGLLVMDIHRHQPGNEAMMLAIAGLAAAAGHLWGARDREERSAADAAATLRAEHDDVAARAVRAERLRLARDLHDVSSHAVGVMVLQAGAAAALRAQDPHRARRAVRTVQSSGTQALSELQMLFGLLDAGAVGAAGLAASPPTELVGGLEALAARMRETGLRVTLAVEPRLPDGSQLAATAYRVVQEALTNAARYASGANVDVSVRWAEQMLEVRVRDDGTTNGPGPPAGGRFGLVGLAERVRAQGGDLHAGHRPEGGFAVTARLPVNRSTEARR